jgi:hypothetical protein
MVDIVQKLRGYRPRYGWPEEYSTIVEPTMNHVAADEIERLRAENARLRKALAKIAQYDMQFIAIDALCPDERIREKRRSDAHER